MRQTTQKNISAYQAWIIPLILLSKLIRWTIMKPQLVNMSIGWGFVPKIQRPFQGFTASWSNSNSDTTGSVSDNAISFFQLIDFGWGSYETWEVVITILFNIITYLLVVQFYHRNPYAGSKERWFIYLNVAILNIFCFNLAKEPYQMIFFVLMNIAMSVPKTYKTKSITLTIALIITILYSRKYYGLVLMYFFVLNFLISKLFGEKEINTKGFSGKRELVMKLLLLAVVFGVFHYVFMSYLQAESADTYNEMVAANSRDWTAAVSEITPLFPNSNPALLAVDYFIKIFRLMIPIELLFKGKVTYILCIIYQIMLLTFLIRTFKSRNRKTNPTRTIALYFYFAFLLCSAAFEPDFGSWMRHQGVAFPVILMLI